MGRALLQLRWILLYIASRAGLLLPRTLIPTGLAYAVAVRVADLCYVCFWGPRKKLIANLRIVTGDDAEARAAARCAFRNYGRYIIDLFQMPALGREAMRSRTDFHAWDALDTVIAEGKGTIFVTMHFGQWETGAACLSAGGRRLNVIARTLEFEPINEMVKGFRQAMGMKIIPAERAGLESFRCLSRNEVLGMLIDMVDPGDGVLVDFLGGKAEMSSAPARIALRTGARIVPAVILRDDARGPRYIPIMDADLLPEPTGSEERDAMALTQRIASFFEDIIRRYPDQWFAFKPVWPSKKSAAAAVDRNDRLNHLALEFANTVFGNLPKPAAYIVARVVGDIAFRLRDGIRADVEDNMRHVLGPNAPQSQVTAYGREVFRNVCRYYADLIRLPRTKPEDLMRKEMRIVGFELLQAEMSGGRGAVIATAHFGNPEVATQIGALLGLDVLVLSEPLNPPAFSDLVHRLRESQGARYEEVGFKTIGRAMAHLRNGGTLAVTCDRDIQDTGTPLPFFGVETRMPLGAAELAARTGAVLMPAYCKRSADGYEIAFEPPIEIVNTGHPKQDAVETTRVMISRMEGWIRSDPGQWMVLERIWKPAKDGRGRRPKPTLGATSAGGA
ncbi:MAG TPA: lysophospholipid acyltransferase family protein [Dehalococcoidia bacterium]